MSKSRMELKVGLFVFVGLVLMVGLILLFSKGTNFFERTIALKMKTANVAGLKRGAGVMMAGVPVGRVSSIQLGEEGTNVLIQLSIAARFKIYDDARFQIEQSGVLGDQFVAIYPRKNEGKVLVDGDVVASRSPFNVQDTVSQAAETIGRIGEVTTNVNAVVTDIRRYVLTQDRLQGFGASLDHFALLTANAQTAVSNINRLVATNSLPVTVAVSNLNQFAGNLGPLAANVNGLVTNNEAEITTAIKNIETASSILTNLLQDLQAGRGTAGRLLRDEEMGSNLMAITHNLSVTTSNLNQGGLWSVLRKPKAPRTNSTDRLDSPRNPYN